MNGQKQCVNKMLVMKQMLGEIKLGRTERTSHS